MKELILQRADEIILALREEGCTIDYTAAMYLAEQELKKEMK